jgi:hypothetical protein
MATGKQILQVRIGAYVFKLGGYVPFAGFPVNIDCWNIDINYTPDFLGDAIQQALTGYERGGTMGWRAIANIELNNTTSAQATEILKLLNVMQSQFNRQFYPQTGTVSAGTVTSSTVVITNGVQINNHYTGLILFNTAENEGYKITDYVGSTRVATVDGNTTTWSGDPIQVLVPPAYPTIIGLAPDTNDNNIEFYNIESGTTFGIQRELTVGLQSIGFQLRGVQRKQIIPDNVRIG